jgi:hypothetical protein
VPVLRGVRLVILRVGISDPNLLDRVITSQHRHPVRLTRSIGPSVRKNRGPQDDKAERDVSLRPRSLFFSAAR